MKNDKNMSVNVPTIPRAFILRRIHSLLGLWLVIFILEHLFTNSQAALLLGEDGIGFIRLVNLLNALPFIHLLEIVLIGIPILFHAGLGVVYLFSGEANSFKTDGTKPAFRLFGRNQAYTWQRITSWILLIGIAAHVGHMRFYLYPSKAHQGDQTSYFVRVKMDKGLYTVADRLGIKLYNHRAVKTLNGEFEIKKVQMHETLEKAKVAEEKNWGKAAILYNSEDASLLEKAQKFYNEEAWINALKKRELHKGQVIAVSNSFGSVTLLNVRDSFKSIPISILYTIFVLAAVFHAFNGLWTFMISWGMIIRVRTQAKAVKVCFGIMLLFAFLSLASIWGTYWFNLRN